MTVFSRLELISGVKLSIKYKASAHSGADKKTYNIAVALGSTVPVLTEYSDVHIIAYVERCLEHILYRLPDVIVLPGKIWREENNSGLLIYNTGRTGSNTVYLINLDSRKIYQLLDNTDNYFFNIGRGISAGLCLLLKTIYNLFLAVENSSEYLGSANIKTNVIKFCHSSPPYRLSLRLHPAVRSQTLNLSRVAHVYRSYI